MIIKMSHRYTINKIFFPTYCIEKSNICDLTEMFIHFPMLYFKFLSSSRLDLSNVFDHPIGKNKNNKMAFNENLLLKRVNK